jgi:hypothetical protein
MNILFVMALGKKMEVGYIWLCGVPMIRERVQSTSFSTHPM